jgi:hypothetical protein
MAKNSARLNTRATNSGAKSTNTAKNPPNLASTVKKAVHDGLKLLPRGTFAKVGGTFGPVGAAVGHALSSISGVGDYEVSGGATVHGGEVPHFTNRPDKTIIKHREFVGAIKSPGSGFTNTTYDINPGNSTLFPWLSTVARSYQQYKILGMVAVYKPLTSDYAAAGGLGQVILATNYNVNDPAFSSAIQMENSEYAVAVKPSKGALHVIECASPLRRNDPFYVYDPNALTSAVSDKRFYDMGKLQVATEGLSTGAGVTIGQLWVTYEIELIKPVLPISVSPAPTLAVYPAYSSATTWSATWDQNITTAAMNTEYSFVGDTVRKLRVKFPGLELGTRVTLMFQLFGDSFVTSDYGTSLNVDPATYAMHHVQASNYVHGTNAEYQVCGSVSGTVVPDAFGNIPETYIDITITRLGTDTTPMTTGNGWLYAHVIK